ncbi:MAG: hypothetical protein ABR949_14905 [Candidatus Aquilonibacter sp.]
MPSPERRASRVGATICVLVAYLLAFAMPNRYVLGPPWLAPVSGIVLLGLFGLSTIGNLRHVPRRLHNGVTVAVVALVTALNILSLVQLIKLIVFSAATIDSHRLLGSSIIIWIGNVLAFALLYWLIDGGGPDTRISGDSWRADFVWPQPTRQADIDPNWRPNFLDYVFLAFSTATAFSPTDTLPLTTRARMLMMVEAAASLLTLAIVAARAVNILS